MPYRVLLPLLALLLSPHAHAGWNPPAFGCAGIDGYASYQGQSTCDPTAKPGVVAFRNAVLAAHPGTWDSGIVRACHIGGASEHKEGRAWDWGVLVGNPAADDVLNKLLATDSCGNPHALARRLGLMYVIWNKKIWRAYKASAGWQPYTGSNPHTDHVHFSFGWSGALAQTSFFGGSCEPSCNGSKIVNADCSSGDCGAFGATCIYQAGGVTCAGQGCTPACNGTAFVDANCGTGDCGVFGAACVLQGGQPKCVVSCTPHCEGAVAVAGDCSKGDCAVFGALCVMEAGLPTCKAPCLPHCEGSLKVSADCSKGDCAAFGGVCEMQSGAPECVVACEPQCQGDVMVAGDCSTGDCGAFGATCVMKGGQPTCKTPCTPHCEGTQIVDAACGVGDCAAFGSTCKSSADGPACEPGCKPHCDGNVKVEADCSEGDCGAFGVGCVHTGSGVTCGDAPCTPHCEGSKIVYSDCTLGDCGVFGLTCGLFDEGPECVPAACEAACNGTVAMAADCSSGDCGVFGALCVMQAGAPTCVSAFCVEDGSQTPVVKDVCVGEERFHCNAAGQLLEKPCPAGQGCNACAGCGPPPAETCDAVDNDCDGQVDEGTKNACGGCGPTPAEVCDYADNDCNGQVDEGVANACGTCGDPPVEICDYLDNDCDGQVDEEVLNACGHCDPVPAEICDYVDNDCDGQVDEGFDGLGEACTAGIGACLDTGAMACPTEGTGLVCTAEALPPGEELCNGVDDDCDGDVDEGLGLGQACTTDDAGCSAPGTTACSPAGGVVCVASESPCDDGDPCTADGCNADGTCRHTPGRCESKQCAPCAADTDCASGGRCLAMGDETRCALPCDDAQEDACPAGLSCTAVGQSTVCLPEEAAPCACRVLPDPVCVGGALQRVDVCGNLLEVVQLCASGCAGEVCADEPRSREDVSGAPPRAADAGAATLVEVPPSPGPSAGGCGVRGDAPPPGALGWGMLILLAAWGWRRARRGDQRPGVWS